MQVKIDIFDLFSLYLHFKLAKNNFQVTMALNMLVQNSTQLESNIVSVERIVEYSNLEQEVCCWSRVGWFQRTLQAVYIRCVVV